MRRLDFIENESLRKDLPPFRVGDTVAVHAKVREGDKERIQVFEGLVIRRRGAGMAETFTVRKISSGVGVERIFPVQSPLVTRLDIKARGYVRRSRLYYLRDLTGKKARLHSKIRDLSGLISEEEAAALESPEAIEVAPPIEEAAEAAAPAEETDAGGKKLKGKARKKARTAEKAKRRVELEAEAKKRAEARAKQEAEAAAAAAAAAESEGGEEAPAEGEAS